MPGIEIGPLKIHYYGIILMLGALAGSWLAYQEVKRRNRVTQSSLDPEIVWDGLVWVLIGGIIGARLWHIFTPPASMVAEGRTTIFYLTHPLDALAIWEGGLGIPGAVIGGGIALYFFCRKRKLNFLVWADIAAPGLALGQAIGRWGNFVNQEVYGAPSSLPWAIPIDPQHRLPGFENIERYHPLFLYESLWNLALLGVLLWVGRRYFQRLKAGDLFLMYLVGYPLGRFWLEFLRLDRSLVGGLNANQTLMALVALIAAAALFYRHRPGSQPPEVSTDAAPQTPDEQKENADAA